jgi:lysophospholipase L1-like esterase
MLPKKGTTKTGGAIRWCGWAVIAQTALILLPPSHAADPPAKVRIVLVGDSTVTDKGGWGAAFARLLGSQAECVNLARSGSSTKSCLKQGDWKKALAQKPDYVLIQFGHNDMPGKGPERETDPMTTYPENLTRFVDEARAAGAVPILVTPMVRRNFTKEGTIRRELEPYAQAMTKVAREKKVLLVDLHARSAALLEKLGPEKAAELDPKSEDPNKKDHTHLSPKGAEIIAPLVAEELKKVEPKLAKLLK